MWMEEERRREETGRFGREKCNTRANQEGERGGKERALQGRKVKRQENAVDVDRGLEKR